MGASSPCVKRWRSGMASVDINDLRFGQASQRSRVLGPLILGDERVDRRRGTVEAVQRRHQLDQRARLQEEKPSRAVVVGQGAEGFVTQRHLGVYPPGPVRVEFG